MKKVITIIMILLLAVSTTGLCAFAAEDTVVYVTIADENGNLALAYEAVTVTDTDDDGILTINDALFCAHEAKYEGGAALGYGSYLSDYGLSMSKLWGVENGGSYGYYLNNASAMSLLDTVKSGDCISAFVYTDLSFWSDTYCFFDKNTVTAEAGEEITLSLSMSAYDENWNPVTLPVENATVTIDGEAASYKTDSNGKVTIPTDKAGTFVVSATSDTLTLVPPACIITITGESITETTETTETTEITETTESTSTEEISQNNGVIDTGSRNYPTVSFAFAATIAVAVLLLARKKAYEK